MKIRSNFGAEVGKDRIKVVAVSPFDYAVSAFIDELDTCQKFLYQGAAIKYDPLSLYFEKKLR